VIMIGFKWELCVVIAIMAILLALAWFKLHKIQLPHSWKWSLFYALIIAAICKVTHYVTHHYIDMEPIHIEVLLPAFVMGCIVDTPCAREELKLQKQATMMKKQATLAKQQMSDNPGPDHSKESVSTSSTDCGGDDHHNVVHLGLKQAASAESDIPTTIVTEAWAPTAHSQEAWATPTGKRPPMGRNNSKESTASKQSAGSKESRLSRHGIPKHELGVHHEELHGEDPWEAVACTVISMVFMVLVGLSMPPLVGDAKTGGGHRRLASSGGSTTEAAPVEDMDPGLIVAHVVAVSFLMIVGKMFPAVCYRDEASLKERFALCLGMCPRGEVGASIIVISLELGVQGPTVVISMCALVINLVMSGGFIGMVKCLILEKEPPPIEKEPPPIQTTPVIQVHAIPANGTKVEEMPKFEEC